MKISLLVCLAMGASPLPAQSIFRVLSYNVENFFDTQDQPDKEDQEFLPTGVRHWTRGRYYHKAQQIAKVITAAGEWDTPALIGLCEVENDSVLYQLTHRTPLRHQAYRYVITQGSDPRGINIALLYQSNRFAYLAHRSIPIRFSRPTHKTTRDLLHVWGRVITGDTLDVFVCHFPSRYGGEKESERDRLDVARTLRAACDSLCRIRATSQLLIMGDFNDTPQDRSLTEIITKDGIYTNLFARPRKDQPPGSHKYQGEWSQLDMILIHRNLMDQAAPMHVVRESARIFAPSFLLTKDKTWRGLRPFRTYYGYKYEGGFSDHLPLIVDFYLLLPAQIRDPHEE